MKNETKHTPGPWRTVTGNDYKSIAVEDSKHGLICEIELADQQCFESDLNDEAKSNARLILSVHYLLAACKKLVEHAELAHWDKQDSIFGITCDQARKAIALAEGGEK